jgi:hypothetical protein
MGDGDVRPLDAEIQDARLGNGKMFVLQASARADLTLQATSLFEAVSAIVTKSHGWLVDGMVRASKAKGFASLMERRAKGELPWVSAHRPYRRVRSSCGPRDTFIALG